MISALVFIFMRLKLCFKISMLTPKHLAISLKTAFVCPSLQALVVVVQKSLAHVGKVAALNSGMATFIFLNKEW